MIELSEHQFRMLDERDQLAEKLKGLVNFFTSPVFPKLSPDEQCLMRLQYTAMLQYHGILHQRIIKFHP